MVVLEGMEAAQKHIWETIGDHDNAEEVETITLFKAARLLNNC